MGFCIVVFGPTGVGKTGFALELGKRFPCEIINCDVGQFYEPLSIGTAKPDWRNSPVKHHLFDVVSCPFDYSAHTYFHDCTNLIEAILKKGKVPLVVGGSGFYVKSLYSSNFCPAYGPAGSCVSGGCNCENKEICGNSRKSSSISSYKINTPDIKTLYNWEDLAKVDIDRARDIHPNDVYRINRAMQIWVKTGCKPSTLKPKFKKIFRSLFVYLDRDQEVLESLVLKRIYKMFESGWIDEVKGLSDDWRPFLLRKGIIGYEEIFGLLEGGLSFDFVVGRIKKLTLSYVAKQRTFWRSMKRFLLDGGVDLEEICLDFNDPRKNHVSLVERVLKKLDYGLAA